MLISLCATLLFVSSCAEVGKPKTEEFYSETEPPRSQEFRWTNGQAPKTFDPAKASAPPETDFVRALYEGLTDTESKTLKPIPAVAVEWSSSEDLKIWTFKLRHDSKWSNGKVVNAHDFVRSWKRLAELGEDVPHHELLKNIVGMVKEKPKPAKKEADVFADSLTNKEKATNKTADEKKVNPSKTGGATPNANVSLPDDAVPDVAIKANEPEDKMSGDKLEKTSGFGVEAVSEFEIKITLVQPDKDFPKLVAHPVFRPVYGNGEEFKKDKLNVKTITNGAFSIESVADDGIVLERADHYWNKSTVKLERVRFVPTKDADSALKAYRDGRVDAVTNAQFEPLALKLLTPYFDFKRVTHSALNLYEFNRQKAPFNDRRVREALALAIERERLTDDEMDGATKPAYRYLPFDPKELKGRFEHNPTKAKSLFKQAGFENGEQFPRVRLVVNRNNIQQRIAKSVAKMWKKELNIETEIVVKELEELETSKNEGDFDVLRRGVVLPTSDETANMIAIFKPIKSDKKELKKNDESPIGKAKENEPRSLVGSRNSEERLTDRDVENSNSAEKLSSDESDDLVIDIAEDHYILTEEEALLEVPGIPLYFPTSYSLVKPYVIGFEMNTLDAPSLKDVEIDHDWEARSEKRQS